MGISGVSEGISRVSEGMFGDSEGISGVSEGYSGLARRYPEILFYGLEISFKQKRALTVVFFKKTRNHILNMCACVFA